MAIQIDEKLLSSEVKTFLNTAKNKSRFLRDALEFYVKHIREGVPSSTNSSLSDDLVKDIKDIKDMLIKQMANNYNPSLEKEVLIDSQEKEPIIINEVVEFKKIEPIQEFIKEKQVLENQQVLTEKQEVKSNNEINLNRKSSKKVMTEEEKEEIRKSIANSINDF